MASSGDTLLQDKVCIVTGAASGIGATIADLFVQQGARVHIFDINGSLSESTASEINLKFSPDPSSHRCFAHEIDVTDAERLSTSVHAVLTLEGRIDVLINNVAIYPRVMFEDMSEQQWDHIMDTNLTSVFRLCKLVVPTMRKQSFGKIVNISSVVIFTGHSGGWCHYIASKAGIVGFSRSLAKEVGSQNIYVNVVTPGAVDTPVEHTRSDPVILAKLLENQTLKKRVLPIDVAQTCLFLASSMSDGITGQIINVDGGLYFH